MFNRSEQPHARFQMGKKGKGGGGGGGGGGQKGKGKGKGISATDNSSLLGVSVSRTKKPSKGGQPTAPRGPTIDVSTIVGGGGGSLGGVVRQKGGVRANSVEIPKPTNLDLSLRKYGCGVVCVLRA